MYLKKTAFDRLGYSFFRFIWKMSLYFIQNVIFQEFQNYCPSSGDDRGIIWYPQSPVLSGDLILSDADTVGVCICSGVGTAFSHFQGIWWTTEQFLSKLGEMYHHNIPESIRFWCACLCFFFFVFFHDQHQ